MSVSNAYVELTPDRLNAATGLVWMAGDVLKNLREQYPGTVGDLPERLAVLEGLLADTYFEAAVQEAMLRDVR